NKIEILEFYKINCEQKELKSLFDFPKMIIICKWCLKFIEKQILDKINKKNIYYTIEEEKERIDFKNSKSCIGKLCEGRLRNIDKFKGNMKWCKKCCKYNKIIQKYITKIF